jgi:hypothetical protein
MKTVREPIYQRVLTLQLTGTAVLVRFEAIGRHVVRHRVDGLAYALAPAPACRRDRFIPLEPT